MTDKWRWHLAEIEDLMRWLMVNNRIKPETAKRAIELCKKVREDFEAIEGQTIYREVSAPGASLGLRFGESVDQD